MKRYDIAIIGAGISGLSLAHFCTRSGLEALVIEKNQRTGGTFCTHRSAASPFWVELGAHTCYNSYGSLLSVMEECGLLGKIRQREKVGYKMFVDGAVRSVPSQMRFGELLLSVPRMMTAKKAGMTIRQYYSSIVGAHNYERVIGPMLSAVISQQADDFPADVLFKKRPRRKDVLQSFTVEGGLQAITEGIASQPGIMLVSGADAVAASSAGDHFSVTTAGGERYEAKALALATPVSAAAALLKTLFPDLSRLLAQVPLAVSEATAVIVRKDRVSLPPVAGIIPLNDSFSSIVSRDSLRDDTYRGFTFHFKPGLSDEEAKRARILSVLGIGKEAIEETATAKNFVPFLTVGHERLLREIDAQLAGKRLLLTGNYLLGLAIEDCVLRSRAESTRLLGMIQ